MTKTDKQLVEYITESPNVLKYIKLGGILLGTVFGIYLLGHFFKITAHCVTGYKELTNSFRNA